MKSFFKTFFLFGLIIVLSNCNNQSPDNNSEDNDTTIMEVNFEKELSKYISFELTTDISHLSANQKEMLLILFEVAGIMDELHWETACGDKRQLLDGLENEAAKKLFIINYGPWNRLAGNKPLLKEVGEKPKGAYFYPTDMTKDEFEAFEDTTKKCLYTVIRRDETNKLISVPYHIAFKEQMQKASDLLIKASELAEDEGFKKYLKLRAEALTTGKYFESDMAWMEMKTNLIEFVVGPIENYEDGLYGHKAAFESFILIKDVEWTEKLKKYTKLLPKMQSILPVPDAYKAEEPGRKSDLGAYDAVFYAGDCNAGSKTIAINLPNDPKVQLINGSRRLQLKNSMKAKFDNILVPISEVLIAEDQRQHIKFDAFFSNTMFHEIAHGLGIKNVLNDSVTCREALQDRYTTLEEGKADVLGLWLITNLVEMNEYESELMDNYVTFVASIFRSIRFGTSSSHAKANLMRYNFFMEYGAIVRNDNGTYSVNFDKIKEASDALAEIIITIQGDGDYEAATELMNKYHVFTPELEADLKKLDDKNIPVDVTWKQGPKFLGL